MAESDSAAVDVDFIHIKAEFAAAVYSLSCECFVSFDEVEVFQSNHEGSIVDKIQEAYGKVDGIVINPAAYTHTSVAILDALKAVAIPAVEVHISAVETREDFRQVSYARLACFATITGEGLKGYAHALELLKEHLEK